MFDPRSVHVGFLVTKQQGGVVVFSAYFGLSCDYYSTNAPYSPSSTHCSYQQEKGMKHGNLPKSSALLQVGENGWKNTLIFFFFDFKGLRFGIALL